MKKIVAATALIGALIGATTVQAQSFAPAKGEDALRYRQSTLFLMGQHFGVLGAMAKGDRPFDAASFAWNAKEVENFSHLPWDSFWVAGADQGKHRMKPEIFTEEDKFLGYAKQLQDETAKLVQVASGSDVAAAKAQVAATGKACGQCHDAFRVK